MNTRKLLDLATDETGVTTLDYALAGALIAAVCAVIVGITGTQVGALYTQVCHEVTTAITGAPLC